MEKNSLLIGLGGVGKSIFNRIMLRTADELQEPEFVSIDCSDIKDIEQNCKNMHMEEKTNE